MEQKKKKKLQLPSILRTVKRALVLNSSASLRQTSLLLTGAEIHTLPLWLLLVLCDMVRLKEMSNLSKPD